jgi:hypothetical protein
MHAKIGSNMLFRRFLWRQTQQFRYSSVGGGGSKSGASSGQRPSLDALLGLVMLPIGCGGLLAEAYFRTELADADDASNCSFDRSRQVLTAHHVRKMERDGIVIIDNVLSAERLAGIRREIGTFSSRFQSSGNEDDVRQDVMQWVRPDDCQAHRNDDDEDNGKNVASENLLYAIRLIRGIGDVLEHTNYKTARDLRVPQDCQLAAYPGNRSAGYRRHLDRCTATLPEIGLLEYWRLSDVRGRVVTAILYLNHRDRTKAEGGALRYWTSAGADDSDAEHFDITPTGGTLVVFDANRIPHQVLPSLTDRTAITCWINGVQVADLEKNESTFLN